MKNRLNRVFPPLLPLVIALTAGIWAGVLFPFSSAWLALVTAISLFPFSVFYFFRPSIVFALLCAFASIWGAVSMARINTPILLDTHISRFANGSGKVISGTIVSLARNYPGKTRVVVACRRVAAKNGLSTEVSGRIQLNIYGDSKKIQEPLPVFGDSVQFYASLHPIRNFANPGGYDYEAQMRYQGIFGSAHVRAGKIKISTPEDLFLATRFFRRVEFIRTRFWHQVRDLGNKKRDDAAAVLTALVVGKKEVLPMEVKENFSKAGVSHLLAISGFHLSLVAWGFYSFWNMLLSRIYLLSVTGRARKIAGIMTLVPLAAYALFTGFSPSTQRALIMVTIFMVAILAEEEKDPLNVLCLAGIIILAIDPAALFSISFQLSFAAVVFIILGLNRVYKWGWMPENRPAAWGAGMAWVTLFAGLGTFPLVARYFNLISSIQIFANLVVVPVMGFVCLPLGFAGLLLGGIHPPFGSWVLGVNLDLLVLCLGFIKYITGFWFSWIRVVTPDAIDLVVIYLFMVAVYLAAVTRKKAAFVFLGLVAAAGVLSAANQLKYRFFPGRLEVTVLDVGQGSAAVVRTPGGHIILIDGGGFPGGFGFDTGRFVVGPFLWRHWVKTLDAVILTHPQADHMNGLVFIMKNFRVKKWIHNRDKNNTQAFTTLTDLALRKKIPQLFSSGRVLDIEFGRTRFTVMPDHGRIFPGDLNNNSLVCRLGYGDFSMLFPGDVESERELLLVRDQNISLASLILMAPHHGSLSSSSKIFLEKVSPQRVIITCGYNNRYEFPHSVIVKRYREMGIGIFRTDLQGAVTVTSSGNGYDIKTHRNE